MNCYQNNPKDEHIKMRTIYLREATDTPNDAWASGDKRTRAVGVRIAVTSDLACQIFFQQLESLGLSMYVLSTAAGDGSVTFVLHHDFAEKLVPRSNTMKLARNLNLDPAKKTDDLTREIILAMLVAPQALEFPNIEELQAAIRIRLNVVHAARRTQLAFHTSEAERPSDLWTYRLGRGFTILPGKTLIAALLKATQPDEEGDTFYSFSCYREGWPGSWKFSPNSELSH